MSLVGKDIIAECTKCKLSLAHIVIYEVKGKVKKVKCKTCGTEHVYKEQAQRKTESAEPGKEKKVRVTRKVAKPAYDAALDWELKKNEMKQEIPVKDYRMEDTYKPGDILSHPIFGLGFVREVSGTSMEVLFKESIKRMAKSFKKSASTNLRPKEAALRTQA